MVVFKTASVSMYLVEASMIGTKRCFCAAVVFLEAITNRFA
jgi:hypothetical protein